MNIFELPLIIFKQYYTDYLIKAQKEIYPTEPKGNVDYLKPFDDTCVTFIESNKRVLGFCVWMTCIEPRTNEVFGTSLWLYVDPENRNGLVAGKLIKEVEINAKEEGAKYFKWDINKDSDLIRAFDKRKEYKKESIVYSKKLDVESLN